MPFKYPAPTMPGEVAQKVPVMADFNYLRQIFDVSVPNGWVLTFDAAHAQNCKWAPGGGVGGGMQWFGEWVDGSYPTMAVVKHSLFRVNDSTNIYVSLADVNPGDAEPGAYSYDAIEPTGWLADGVNQVVTFDGNEPVFYDSNADFIPGDISVDSVIIYNVNLTSPGDLVLSLVAIGSIGDFWAILYGPGINQPVYSGDLPFTFVGLGAGVYNVMLFRSLGGYQNGNTFTFKVATASGSVIGAAPTQKWQLAQRHDWPQGTTFADGKIRQSLFNTQILSATSGAVTLNLSENHDWLVPCNGTVTSISFTTAVDDLGAGFVTGTQTLRLTFVQNNGSGALASTIFTAIASPYTIDNAADVPTSLGVNVGDSLVVYIHSEQSDLGAGAGFVPRWSIIGWSATDRSSRRELSVPATGFSLTVSDGVDFFIMDPAGTLATGTVTMPANPTDNQTVTISSTQVITALTVSPNAFQSLKGAATTLTGKSPNPRYVWNTSDATWYPV